MKEFNSFAGFALHLAAIAAEREETDKHLMEKAARIIERAAKKKIGEYQDQSGQFVAWAELADSTKADRERQGYPEDEPLLRNGTLRDSIGHNSSASEAHIGSNLDIVVYQELGTDKIPPRSFLGGAAFEQAPKVVELIGEGVSLALAGEKVFNRSLDISNE